MLSGLFAAPEPCDSPAVLLRGHAAVVPLRGGSRHELLDELVGWCTDTQPFGVRLVTGASGQGKARLGEELIRRLSATGWVAGHVVDRPPADAVAALARLDRPVLLVVGDAMARCEQLGQLVTAARGCGQPARLLLLARARAYWADVAAKPQFSSITTAPARRLDPVEDDPDGRLDAWREAAAAFASRLPELPGHEHIDWTAAANQAATTAERLTSDRFATMLGLHMDALAAVLQAGHPVAAPAEATSEDVLLLHLQRYWRRVARTHGLDALDDTTLRRCVTIAALWTAPDRGRADMLIRAIPGVRDLDDGHAAVVDWLANLYPALDRCWAQPRPDRLAEHLIATELVDQPALATATGTVASTDQWQHALTVLSDAAIDYPHLDSLITDMVADGPGTVAAVAAQVATQVERPEPLVAALTVIADRLGDESIDLLAAIADVVPLYGPEHRDFADRLTERLVTLHRARADIRPDVFEPGLAASLNKRSQHLYTWGRSEEAQAADEEAIAILRRLAETQPDAFEPDLAASLCSLASLLGMARRRDDAVAAVEEATAIYRRLAAARPGVFEPELAKSLFRLSVQRGTGEDGLAALEEAVTVYRRLATTRPDAFEPELARSLDLVSVLLSIHPTRHRDGLAAIEEATAINRRLTTTRAELFQQDLARALERLSWQVTRRVDALAATEEATTIFRRMATTWNDVFERSLARSLYDLSSRLAGVGRHEDALAALEEATTIFRRLATAEPDEFEPALARTLNNRSVRLARLGRENAAMTAIDEATAIRRGLVTTRSDAHEPDLAASLNNLSLRLAAKGRREDALAAIDEATAIYRRAVTVVAHAFDPALAMTLNNLSLRLADLGRHEDALAAIKEAVVNYRHLCATRHGAFQRELAASLNNLSLCLADLGRDDEALAAIEETIAIHQRPTTARPDAFEPDRASAVRTYTRLLDHLGRLDEASTSRMRYGLDPDDPAVRPSIELDTLDRPSPLAPH